MYMRYRMSVCLIVVFFSFKISDAQYIPVPDNLTCVGMPQLPVSVVQEVKPYTEARGAGMVSWHPLKREMMISTRFANTNQLHYVKMPGGDRKQMSFFDEPLGNANFEPVNGNYFLFIKDMGGNEFGQIFSYDMASRKTKLLTKGGRTQHGSINWNKSGSLILYTSTLRNGKDRDVYMMNPLQPETAREVLQLEGGGWSIADWSDDEKYVLLNNGISVNETAIWLYDIANMKLMRLLPAAQERTVYDAVQFARDGASVFLFTNKDREYGMPVLYNMRTQKMTPLVGDMKWEVEDYVINEAGTMAAFRTNESGVSKLYIQNLTTYQYNMVQGIATGVIGGLEWHKKEPLLAYSFVTSNAAADVYVYNAADRGITRWTESEAGGMSLDGVDAPQLIKWKSFDGLEVSGFLYRANKKFTGKRPVIIQIHGGPEGQSQPVFINRSNYYLNELGISIIYPNVRGSTGFGKTFTDLDNGMNRESSVKDIGALLDWVAAQPDLDASRIMITGGSYGGYMTLACAFHYNDKIRCALDVVGISNFNTFLKNTEAYRRDLRRVEYGDERDPAMAAFFEKIAPLNNAEKITKPLFIVQGRNDPRVPYTEAVQMMEKVKGNGGTVWYLEAADEGHGFQKKQNVDYQFYATVFFIQQYLLN